MVKQINKYIMGSENHIFSVEIGVTKMEVERLECALHVDLESEELT